MRDADAGRDGKQGEIAIHCASYQVGIIDGGSDTHLCVMMMTSLGRVRSRAMLMTEPKFAGSFFSQDFDRICLFPAPDGHPPADRFVVVVVVVVSSLAGFAVPPARLTRRFDGSAPALRLNCGSLP